MAKKKRKSLYKYYLILLILGFLLLLPPVHNHVFRFWFWINGSSETITLTFQIHDLVSNGMKEEDRAEVTGLLLKSLDSVTVKYAPVVAIDGVTEKTKSWWSYEGLIGVGGLGWFERRSSTETINHVEKAQIVEIDLEKAQVIISLKIEPTKYYRPRYIEFDFKEESALDSLIHYQVNGTSATADAFVLGIPMMLVVDGKQDFFHRSTDSDYRRTGIYFTSYDSPYNSSQGWRPIDRSEIIFSLKTEQELPQKSHEDVPEISLKVTNIPAYDQPKLSKSDREKLIFTKNTERDVYRFRREWFDYADPLREQKSDYALPGYLEKGLLLDTENMMDLNIYRTFQLPDSYSDFLSFDEHWQVSQGRLMSVELISSSYEGGVNMSSCWFGAEIRRDDTGDLRRYFNQWFFMGSQKPIEIDIDNPESLEQVIDQALMTINSKRSSQNQSEAVTSGNEEGCSLKLGYVHEMLLMNEEALLERLEYLQKVIVP